MSEDLDDHTESVAPPPKPRGISVGLAGLAVLVALLALALAAWSVWRLQRATHVDAAARDKGAAVMAALESRLAANGQQAQADSHRLAALESGMQELGTNLHGLDRRLANLETAYSHLSGQQQSGHDRLLLDDVEMLLRTGQQRYELFHDTTGARKAYTQAIEVLSEVQNPAYAPVRASVATERDAIARAAPPSRQAALDALSALRDKVATLPLPVQAHAAASDPKPKSGFWSRLAGAFGSIVKVSRDDGQGVPLADPRFARQELALDLAQAQESLLAFDHAAVQASLQRADATLASRFPGHDAAVQAARAQLATLLARHAAGPPPQLGGALAQLASLRASQPVMPDPVTATSSGASKP